MMSWSLENTSGSADGPPGSAEQAPAQSRPTATSSRASRQRSELPTGTSSSSETVTGWSSARTLGRPSMGRLPADGADDWLANRRGPGNYVPVTPTVSEYTPGSSGTLGP